MPRLFVALALPEDIKDLLEPVCGGLAGARWVHDRQFHVTLSFAGEVEEPVARALEDGLVAVRGRAFRMRLAGVGHFPPRGTPRVLWAGVEAGPELVRLADAVRACSRRLGAAGEDRRFHPHVTLARLAQARLPAVLDFLATHSRLASEPFVVGDFRLCSSVLGGEGATHRVVACYPLEPERDGAPDERGRR